MPPRGRKPDTNEQKTMKGEKRPSRLSDKVVEFPAVDRVPDPPEWLNEDGKELWREMAPLLFMQKVLTKADLYALSHLCRLHGSIVYDYKRQVPPTAAELTQLRMYFAEFGMTPSSRTRVHPAGDGNNQNPFRKNGKKNKTPVS